MSTLKLVEVRTERDDKPSASLVAGLSIDQKANFMSQWTPGTVTDRIKVVLLKELNTKLMPSDDRSAGWEVRESERHGEIKALKKAIELLP